MDTNTVAIILMVGLFFGLMVLRLGVGLAMGLATIATMVYLKMPISVVFQGMVSGTKSYTFMAVPFFIFMGEIMSAGGISDRIINFAKALVGWIRGGGAYVNVVASMFFGGISGSATGDTAALGPLEIKLMTSQGYDKEYSTSLTMASSVQGMLIPPSHNMVVYSVAAGSVSVGALLMAGLIPGIVLGIALMIYSYFYAIKHQIPKCGKFDAKELVKTTITAMWGLSTIIVILLGVNGGIMTATESAAIAAAWALVVSVVIYKDMKIKQYYAVATKAIKTLSMIFLLIAASNSFGWLVAFLKIPAMITEFILSITTNKYVILMMINILLIFLGMVMSMSSIIIILTPILVPILQYLDVNLVHFGVIMILNLGIGLITPPVGGVLYIGSAISGIKVNRLIVSTLPLYAVMFIVLLLLTYIPQISLWFPQLVGAM